MAGEVTYKDISELSQKSTIEGTEKIPVSDSEYITPSQIAGTATKPGTLDTTQTTSQNTSNNEALSGTVKLHKVSKTGKAEDLITDSTHRLVTDAEKTTWSGKQEALQSGVNIKTINNISILGEGNIDVSGGAGSVSWGGIGGNLDNQIDLKNALSAKYEKPSTGIPKTDLASGVVPDISTDISSDASSDVKTASPKAVKTFVEGKGYGTYSKPSGGIPASDLASGVIPTVPTISTNITTDATSDTKTASPKAVKTYVDGKIPSVPSISTSVISDKSSDTKTSSPKSVYDFMKPTTGSSIPSGGLVAGKTYRLGTLTGSKTINLATPSDTNVVNLYHFTFTAGSTAPSITWPSSITQWSGNCIGANSVPTISAGFYYEVMIDYTGAAICNVFAPVS